MIQRELIFYPEVERFRDLVYSEYTSLDRSIHVLLQENSAPQYRFLLKAYREIVSSYLSASNLKTPTSLLSHFVDTFESLAKEERLTVDDFSGMGFYIVLHSADGIYVLTSSEHQVLLHDQSELTPIGSWTGDGVERLRFDEGEFQKELFPQQLSDCLFLFKLSDSHLESTDLILGCGEEEKSTVIEALNDPSWTGLSDKQQSVTSKFLSRRIVGLRIEVDLAAAAVADSLIASSTRGKSSGISRRAVLVGATAVIALLLGGYWISDVIRPENQTAASRSGVNANANREIEPVVQGTVEQKDIQEALSLVSGWETAFDNEVTSSPALHEESVIFGCRDGHVYALDRSTGKRLWDFKASDGVGASPSVSVDRVISADYAGNVFALRASTGERIWNQLLPMKVVSSPKIAGDRILVGCYDGYAYCLSMQDGEVLWKYKTGNRVRGNIEILDDIAFVPSYDGHLYAVALATGKLEWRYQVKGQIAGSPAISGKTVIVGSPDGSVHAVDVVTGSLVWKRSLGGPVKSTPTINSGRVLVGSNDSKVYCLSSVDGSQQWVFETGDVVLSRPRVKNGSVYVGSYDGFLYRLDLTTGNQLDRFDSGGSIYSSPAVDDGRVYFGNNRGKFISLRHNAKQAL